jgi:glutamate racemase
MAQGVIGVFDSGIGGLSVLRELRATLPAESFVYWADSGHAPYGERGDAFVRNRSLKIVQTLRAHYRVKAIVVACNTATAAAIDTLRAAHPGLPIVGIEPALKPATRLSRTGHIGVLATRGTLSSERFAALAARVAKNCQLHLQPCDGLAEAIERLAGTPQPTHKVQTLIDHMVAQLPPLGSAPAHIDTLVLGCTHYPLAWPHWQQRVQTQARLINPAAAVARQLQRVLSAAGALNDSNAEEPAGDLVLLSSGSASLLQAAVHRWLRQEPHDGAKARDQQ